MRYEKMSTIERGFTHFHSVEVIIYDSVKVLVMQRTIQNFLLVKYG